MNSLLLLSLLVGAAAVLPWMGHRIARRKPLFLGAIFLCFFTLAFACGWGL